MIYICFCLFFLRICCSAHRLCATTTLTKNKLKKPNTVKLETVLENIKNGLPLSKKFHRNGMHTLKPKYNLWLFVNWPKKTANEIHSLHTSFENKKLIFQLTNTHLKSWRKSIIRNWQSSSVPTENHKTTTNIFMILTTTTQLTFYHYHDHYTIKSYTPQLHIFCLRHFEF